MASNHMGAEHHTDPGSAGAEPAAPSGGAHAGSSPRKGGNSLVRWLNSGTDRASIEQLLVIAAIIALCVYVRWLRIEPIEIAGDNTYKWNFVRQWFHNNDFSHAKWSHHTARLGINVPVFFVQAFSAETARAYYVTPIASYVLQVVLVYLLGQRLGGRAAGLLGALWLTVFTGMNRDASQLLPDGFGGTALALFFYLLVRYHDAVETKRMRWLIGAGLAFVWAYFVKESNLLFLPSVVVATWLCRRSWRDAALVAGMLALAFVLETACYRSFTDYSSRFNMVQEAHGSVTVQFPQLFDRFTRLEPPWQMLFYSWLASAFSLVASRDARIRGLLLIPASFIFLLTFLVRSFDPIVLWTRFMSRYFGAPLPLMIVAVSVFCIACARAAWPVYAPPRLLPLAGQAARYGTAISVSACALVAFVTYKWTDRPAADNPLRQIPHITRVVNDAYRRNLPIVQDKERAREERARGLETIYAMFLKQKDILTSSLSKDGRLPDVEEVVQYERSRKGWEYGWLVRDPAVYSKREVHKLDDDGCAVRVRIVDGRFFKLESDLLPPHCRAPEHAPRR
jgi:Dolichyl-phosphate-mannose-protein mannosyltransferase